MVRSSVMSNCLEGKCSFPALVNDVLVDGIEGNYFAGRLQRRRRSLSLSERVGEIDLNNISDLSSDPSFNMEDVGDIRDGCKVLLGENAKKEVLVLPGTPRASGGTPKRSFSPDRKTPTGRPRKISTSLMNSPVLKPRLILTMNEELATLSSVNTARIGAREEGNSKNKKGCDVVDYEGRKASCSADIISGSSTSARMSAREQISLTKTDSEDLWNKTQDCSSTAARMEANGSNNSNSHDQRELENKIQECGSTSARMDARGWSG